MAEPNLMTPTMLNGKTTVIRVNSATTLILSNPVDSNKTIKINALSIKFRSQREVDLYIVKGDENIDGNIVYYDSFISGPTLRTSRWKVINKTESIYLNEGYSMKLNLAVGSSTYGDVYITISYEEIS